MRPLKLYFDFSGRSSRTELVSFLFLVALAQAAVSFIASAIHIVLGQVVGILLGLALLTPWLALITRRLHDQGKSAAWWALLGPISVLAAVSASVASSGGLGVSTLLQIAAITVFWVILLQKGQAGDNRFGPDPRSE